MTKTHTIKFTVTKEEIMQILVKHVQDAEQLKGCGSAVCFDVHADMDGDNCQLEGVTVELFKDQP